MMAGRFFQQKGHLLTEATVAGTATALVAGGLAFSDKLTGKSNWKETASPRDDSNQSSVSPPAPK